MAFRSEHYTLSDTVATKIVDAVAGDVEVWVRPFSTTADLWIGGDSSVDSSSGYPVDRSGYFHTRVRPGDELWAISPSSTVLVGVIIRSA